MQFLRQTTAATVKIGPFVDESDGVTALNALAIGQADVLLSKSGAAFAQKADASACVNDADGWYACALNASDAATAGRLQVSVQVAGACPVWQDYFVLPANVYDSAVGTDNLIVDVTSLLTAGATTCTVVLRDGSGNPVADADVWVTSDAAGLNVVEGTRQTDSFGRATFYLNAGTYYRWAQKDGTNFTNPSAFTVA